MSAQDWTTIAIRMNRQVRIQLRCPKCLWPRKMRYNQQDVGWYCRRHGLQAYAARYEQVVPQDPPDRSDLKFGVR